MVDISIGMDVDHVGRLRNASGWFVFCRAESWTLPSAIGWLYDPLLVVLTLDEYGSSLQENNGVSPAEKLIWGQIYALFSVSGTVERNSFRFFGKETSSLVYPNSLNFSLILFDAKIHAHPDQKQKAQWTDCSMRLFCASLFSLSRSSWTARDHAPH